MNHTQASALRKLMKVLKECESEGVHFASMSTRLDVEGDVSYYVPKVSSEGLAKVYIQGIEELVK
jgi:hypothetical protein